MGRDGGVGNHLWEDERWTYSRWKILRCIFILIRPKLKDTDRTVTEYGVKVTWILIWHSIVNSRLNSTMTHLLTSRPMCVILEKEIVILYNAFCISNIMTIIISKYVIIYKQIWIWFSSVLKFFHYDFLYRTFII